MTDRYIKHLMMLKGDVPKELIKAKRNHLTLKRILNERK